MWVPWNKTDRKRLFFTRSGLTLPYTCGVSVAILQMRAMRWTCGLGSALALLALAGCSPKIDYVGETYPPTTHVALFFKAADVARPYKVMGKAIVTASEGSEASKMQETLLTEARARGADAVLVERFGTVKTGESSHWDSSARTEGRTKTKEKRGREKGRYEGTTSTHGSESTSYRQEKRIDATFLKYIQSSRP